MKRSMVITIDDNRVAIKAMNNDPGHSKQLVPFEEVLSNKNKALVHTHIHDHEHDHNHVHNHAH